MIDVPERQVPTARDEIQLTALKPVPRDERTVQHQLQERKRTDQREIGFSPRRWTRLNGVRGPVWHNLYLLLHRCH